jgi:hypothetical protein
VTVVGPRDASAIKLEHALKPLQLTFEYRDLPLEPPRPRFRFRGNFRRNRYAHAREVPSASPHADLSAYLRALTPRAASNISVLYVVPLPRMWKELDVAQDRSQTFLKVVETLQALWPETPILATTAWDAKSWLVDKALHAGADEVLRSTDLAIESLVFQRIRRLLESFRSASTSQYGAAAYHGDAVDTAVANAAAAGHTLPDVNDAEAAPLTDEEIAEASKALETAAADMHPVAAQASWWASVDAIPAPSLRAASHRLDAEKVAQRLGVPPAQLCALASPPLSRQGIKTNPDSERLQIGLAAIARVIDALDVLIPERDAQQQWLRTPHLQLNDKTPLELMLAGDGMRVAAMLGMLREGVVD